jgi:glycosyltransferase involved in cell wall biosynthesis
MSKVSIILPTYNGSQYISSLLDSILLQTYKDIEYIIIDDKSTDNTVKIIQNYIKKDLRIKLYFNPVNLGINKSFEKGIKLSSGNYIFLCDQDDLWDRKKVKKMVNKIEQGYDLVYSDLKVINSDGNLISKSFHGLICTNNLQSKNVAKYLLFKNITNGCSMCFRRELIDDIIPFPDNLIYDWWLIFKVSLKHKIGKLDEQLMSYRIHDRNAIGFLIISRDDKAKIDNIQKSLNTLTLFSEQKNILNYKQCFCILFKYYNIRINFIKHKTNLIRYYFTSVILLYYFPRLYKYIFKNIIEDTLPKLHIILIKIWVKQKMKV